MKATSKNQSVPQQSFSVKLLCEYFKDIDSWSSHWEISEEDHQIGQDLIEEFKKFLIYCLEKRRAKRTIKNHAGYLQALGGELIQSINNDEDERSLSAEELILKHVDDSGGPYWRYAYNDDDHDRYDASCRQFFKFMTTNPN